MARPHKWTKHVPKLLEKVQSASQSHYEREDIAVMFGVKSRTAASLLGLMNTVTIGNKVLVTRKELLEFLRMFASEENLSQTLVLHKTRTLERKAEASERAAQAQKIEIARALSVRKPINWPRVKAFATGDGINHHQPDDFPKNIKIEKGTITLQFMYLTDIAEALGWLAGYINTKEGENYLTNLCVPEWGNVTQEEAEEKSLEKRDADSINSFIATGTWPEEMK